MMTELSYDQDPSLMQFMELAPDSLSVIEDIEDYYGMPLHEVLWLMREELRTDVVLNPSIPR